ncbi:MAG: RecX family transcriptional regulator [Anaerolineales bacterium]|nr:RecX family transcriptional regulator [Anaerolineales bacterium]
MAKIITALQAQTKNQDRINVFLDGQFAFGLSRIVAAWLKIGQSLTDEKIESLIAADEREIAYQRALRFIAIRQRSSSELRAQLTKHKTPPELIEETISRLQNNHLINDEMFAQAWVENRTEFKPRSRRALSIELRQKGVSDEIIDQALENIDDNKLALKTAMKHGRKLANLDWIEFRKKMLGHLARRGFNYELSSTAVAQTWEELHALEISSSAMNYIKR